MTWKQVFKKHWERQAAQSSPIVTLYIVIYIGRRDTRLHNVVGGFALWWKLRRFDLWKINVPPESESPNQNELLLDLSAFSQYDIEICSKMFVFLLTIAGCRMASLAEVKRLLLSCNCYWSECFCPPPDGETDVAFYLSVCGQTVQRDDRAGGERRQPSPQLLLLHQDRHGSKGNNIEAAKDSWNDYIFSTTFLTMLSLW